MDGLFLGIADDCVKMDSEVEGSAVGSSGVRAVCMRVEVVDISEVEALTHAWTGGEIYKYATTKLSYLCFVYNPIP